jgi:CheY-like chemotaxis protein
MTKARILVADDEESLRVVIRNSLRQKGYEVDCAEDGKQAAKMIDQTNYDVILADIRMPEMDGFKLLERIQAGLNRPPSS